MPENFLSRRAFMRLGAAAGLWLSAPAVSALAAQQPPDAWARLREAVVGNAQGEAGAQLDALAARLEQLGVTVHRPEHPRLHPAPWAGVTAPRNCALILGNKALGLSLRAPSHRRDFEALLPALTRAKFTVQTMPSRIGAKTAAFLRGNDILVSGRDIIIGHNSQGTNAVGIAWLRRHLGRDYRVFALRLARHVHSLDEVLCLPTPQLGLICRQGLLSPLPASLGELRLVDVASSGDAGPLVIGPGEVLCDEDQPGQIDNLRALGLKVHPLPLGALGPHSGPQNAVLPLRRG